MPEDRFAPLRKALVASATRPLHLAAGATGLGVSVLSSALEFGGQLMPGIALGFGVLAYAAMVALDVTNPEFVRRTNSRFRVAEDNAAPLLHPILLRDVELREVYENILAAYNNCRRLYAETSESLRSNLDDGLRRSQELVIVAGRVVKRGDSIRRHLDDSTPEGLNQELDRLRALAEKTHDEAARSSFQQAAESKAKELETYRQLQGLHDRTHAQLRVIETSLEGLAARLVKLDATDVSEALSINQSIAEHVQTMTTDAEILESAYDQTIEEFRA